MSNTHGLDGKAILRFVSVGALCLLPTGVLGAQPASAPLYEQAKSWRNPAPMREDWRDGVALVQDGGLWQLALVDGAGVALPSPYHAGSIAVDGQCVHRKHLSLTVSHDPTFDAESDDDWQPGMAAASRYNNAFLTGLAGWMPRPAGSRGGATQVVVEFRARWPKGYESLGTSGVWLEQQGTFDDQGLMVTQFQAAGLSYTSALSFLFPGLAIEGVTGFVPDSYAPVPPLDISHWHEYSLALSWNDPTSMQLSLSIDHRKVSEIAVVPFGPFEVQIWRDNYLVVEDPAAGYRISYMNFPVGWEDAFQVGDMRVFERRLVPH